MSNTLILNQSMVGVGLVTQTYTVPTTGAYNVRVDVTEIPPSGLSIVVNDNGSPIYTAATIGQTQSAIQFKYGFLATATHTITVVLSSSSANDNLLNSVKSIISIGQGL